MKPTDLRFATWQQVLTHLTDDLARVHEAWLAFGPGTTRAVAERAGISLLTLRPRTTDLYKLGLVDLVDASGIEGVYAHRTPATAESSGHWRTRADFSRAPARLGHRGDGFASVEAAVASLPAAERVALARRLLAEATPIDERPRCHDHQMTLLIRTA